tara:strand:- start:35 stop:1495 length:1461 start_codon:yes stop_codon:yes gene_type:complete
MVDEKIVSINLTHNAALTYVVGNEIIFHFEFDRFNRIKGSNFPCKQIIDLICDIEFDLLLVTSLNSNSYTLWENIMCQSSKLKNKLNNVKVHRINEHHALHAAEALLWGTFSNIVVADGRGKNLKEDLWERESIFKFNNKKLLKNHFFDEQIGFIYEKRAFQIFNAQYFTEGKLMALSTYGEHDNQWFNNQKLLQSINQNKVKTSDKNYLNIATTTQNYIEDRLAKIFTKIPQGEKVAFTGGVAQNVLANSKLKKEYKKLFCSPYNNDSGISAGSANLYKNFNLKIKSIYTGIPQYFSLHCTRYSTKNVSLDEVCNLLEKEPVAIFKKRSESGQRGLGARSILISPCIKNSYEKMNEVKKRAWFRPFALSILDEHGEDWFEDYFYSPYMMYIFNLKKNKKNILKNGLCVKDTSRIQSVRKEDNLEYYNLINCFYKRSGVPMLVNTSFNLPGEVLVETYTDLDYFLKNSKLNYVFLPEYGKLIYGNN